MASYPDPSVMCIFAVQLCCIVTDMLPFTQTGEVGAADSRSKVNILSMAMMFCVTSLPKSNLELFDVILTFESVDEI